MQIKSCFKIKAFTLAEVLITLMVIGVLAVITIPSILQSWEEQATVAKLKKTYSVLQQAYKMAELENGTPETWGLSKNTLLDNVVPYLPVLKNCKNGTGCMGELYTTLDGRLADGCWYNCYESDAKYDESTKYYKILLKDDVSIAGFMINHPNWSSCSITSPTIDGYKTCAIIYADVNGPKPPNQYGKDTFWFILTKVGFIPFGGANTQSIEITAKHYRGCTQTGYACTRWVIERGNMEYLHKNTTW